MTAYIEEAFVVITSFFVLFSILFCCIKADHEDSYTRQLRLLRNHKCECQKCNNGDNGDNGEKENKPHKEKVK